MPITVAELRLLKNSIQRKLQELLRERSLIAFVEYDKGEDYLKPDRTFEAVNADIEKVRSHQREVKKLLAVINLRNTIPWNDEEISIVEALELVKQLRAEEAVLQVFGNAQLVERISRGAFEAKVSYKKALFDPPSIKKEASRILKEANRLSILIDKANFNATVDIDFVDEYQ